MPSWLNLDDMILFFCPMVDPVTLAIAVVVCTVVALVVKRVVSPPPKGKNPFKNSTIKPPAAHQPDQAVRDKVLKQGYTSKEVPEQLDAIVIGR